MVAHGAVLPQNHKLIYFHGHYQSLSNQDRADLGGTLFLFYFLFIQTLSLE